MESPVVRSILVLTEDSGDDGHATIVAVLKRMLRVLDTRCQTHHLDFEPKNEQAQRAIRGPRWKSTNPRDNADLTTLWATIATKLARGGFVFFHVDGDRPWSQRATSENAAKFEAIARQRVRQHLHALPTEAERERAMKRFFAVVPHYSIEAWLYQNTRVATDLCRSTYDGRDVEQFETWASDRRSLDDVVKPKERVCLAAAHNLALASTSYPAEQVYNAGRSYADVAEQLLANEELLNLLVPAEI